MDLFGIYKYRFPYLYELEFQVNQLKNSLLYNWRSDKNFLERKFRIKQGYNFDINNPKTLNEVIQWLKINERYDFHTICADKYRVRDYLSKHFSEEFFIPILFHTENYKDIELKKLPNEPFIIKTNHDSGHYLIVRRKEEFDWKKVKLDFKYWMKKNYFYNEREWQYKNIKPCVIAEKLLICKNGRIPNDYKIHCINGIVEFIYVASDREGENKRCIYDRNWNPLFFTWAAKGKNASSVRGEEQLPPPTLTKMISFAEIIAIDFPKYVRVDFYDVDGKLYFGEITQHHGGGFDQIRPFEFDKYYGSLIKI
jgi:hypothetical protein